MAIYTSEPVIGGKRLRCRHCLHNERCDDQLIGGDKAALRVWPSFVADLARCCGTAGQGGDRPAVAVLLGLLTEVRYAVVTA